MGIDCIYGPVFRPTTRSPTALFWMASGRCDFQPQSVWSVFACGRAVGGEDILRWNSTLKTCKDRIDIGPPVAQFDEFSKAT